LVLKVNDVNSTDDFVSYNTKGMASKIHPDHPSDTSTDEGERGIQLTNRMMGREARCLLPSFKEELMRAKAVAIHRFTHSIGLVQHAATHTAQKHFTVAEDDSKDLIVMMRMTLQGQDPNDILNMDQMPIPYSYHSNKTLEVMGSKPVQQRSLTSETKHIMLAATVTASGKMLTPFLIFKGEQNG
jgi:hypothetical protein